jgi:hypothetical protein
MKTEAFDKITKLKSHAKSLSGFYERYAKLSAETKNDKMGEGFNLDDRFTSFSAKLSFTTWLGTYGNSSCSTLMGLDPDIGRDYLVKAANVHRKLILQTMAELMDADALKLVTEAKAEAESMLAKIAEVEASTQA